MMITIIIFYFLNGFQSARRKKKHSGRSYEYNLFKGVR